MKELESKNNLRLLPIPDLCEKKFFIPEYQRGYRWGTLQVKQLLEDLYTFFNPKTKSGDFYCLQPIVVKKMDSDKFNKYRDKLNKFGLPSESDNNNWYEVIDGQQRLTTIKIILILASLYNPRKKMDLTLFYETRHELGDFFNKLTLPEKNNNEDMTEVTTDEQNLDIDSWHILKAANTIIRWFQTKTKKFNPTLDEFEGTFYQYFTSGNDKEKYVQVIWYELCDNSEPYDMFKRLNNQKVSLNNAELIRALFLSDSADYPCSKELLDDFDDKYQEIIQKREQYRKQHHIIEMWDIIESQLRNDKFWAFIKDDNDATGYSCRIEYIFDLISKKGNAEKDPLYTYLEFEKKCNEDEDMDLWKLWMEVERCYSLLKYWFENNDYYHEIGYLITISGPDVLGDLLSKSSTCSKKELEKDIKKKIQETIMYKDNSKGILDYTYEEDYKLLKNVLFLYNVVSTSKRKRDFFPFEEYKKEKNWTLEHIHAQNSELIDKNDKNKWEEWFTSNLTTLQRLQKVLNLHSDEKIKEEIKDLCEFISEGSERLKNHREDFTFQDLTTAFNNVVIFFNNLNKKDSEEYTPPISYGVTDMIHGIANMALLSGTTNSSISNTVFEVKRQKIMEADAKGEYIPLCTRNVFLKYYNCGTKENDDNNSFTVQQNFYWSVVPDRENYLKDIEKTLEKYIQQDDENSDVKQKEESEVTNE